MGSIFFPDNDYVRQVDYTKDYWNPQRKLGVTTHFSEIDKLKYGENLWNWQIKKSYLFFPNLRMYTLTGTNLNAMTIVTRLKNKEQMVTKQPFFIRLFWNIIIAGWSAAVIPIHAFT